MSRSLPHATMEPHPVASPPSYKRAKKDMDEADRAKEREFYRYFHHSQRPKSEPDRSRQPAPAVQPPKSLPSPPPLRTVEAPRANASEDKALNAFAQLGALRLNTRRCLISFFDRRNCYVLAEATRTTSLHSGHAEFREDSLCWGSTLFSKEKSICYYTVNLPMNHAGPAMDDYNDVPSLIVEDLSRDDRFKNYPFVVGYPHSRFYAGVPIRSPTGHSIGTFCVLDDKPRAGLTVFELSFLKDMAVTVMRHLEMTRATDDHRRGGIMIRSLGSFAEGKSSIEDWWHDPWDTEPTASIENSGPASDPRQRRETMSRKQSADSAIISVKSPTSNLSTASTAITPASETVIDTRALEATKSASAAKDGSRDHIAPEIKATFSRAANMIVESTEAEGAVFFDAKVSTFGGLVDDEFLSEQPPEPDKPCRILGISLSKSASISSIASKTQSSMSESVLRHLLRSYPHGQIFNFDAEATPVTPVQQDTQTDPDQEQQSSFSDVLPLSASRRSESARSQDDENVLREVFPNARSLVLYPLWDSHRDRWFAGAIVWSSDPMRVLTSEQEMSYLAAFSNSVMAEVARLDTKLADTAKADFISSISHELRSPLHGILGTTELLKDTQIDAQQSNHTQTIEICGNTLLDTINHVLDFAKINNLTRGTSKPNKKRSQGGKHVINPDQGHTNDITTLTTDVDMTTLTEEALESVFAGYNFQKSVVQPYEKVSSSKGAPPVDVIVDINKSNNYVFRTQPGAWRRVLMNLFGNALKYTPAGYIKIKLQATPVGSPSEGVAEFRMIVTDSGIGMSEDYINNRLFHSFAQENPLSQGTGLGLSIVKQIVESLGGDIEVRSEKGRGTKFTVYCPLKSSIMSPAVGASGPERALSSINKRTEGMNVYFVGFEEEDEYFPVKTFKNKNATKLTLKALDNLCTDWFGMRAHKYSSPDAPPADLFVATEAGAKWLRARYSKDPDSASTAPVIVLCQGAASAQSTTAITVPGQIFECISQPCGPHKLAKALKSCLDRHANRLMGQSTETDSHLSSIVPKLSLKENNRAVRQDSLASVIEQSRPPMMSALSAPEVRAVTSPVKKKHESSQHVLNCLAVDDNPINLRLLRTFVGKLGHRHVLATNGLEALEAYKAASPGSSPSEPPSPTSIPALLPEHIDVILMDINMPEMDGLEATRQIRSHERDHGLPPVTIIALTGVASSEAQQEAHVSGVNLFLIKPVRLADLEVVLKGVVTGEEHTAGGDKK
ncbi:sensor histidine kinase-like protein/response regulator [Massariosphaeria phaeospora]|uniref:Sensor histidine kinase-like protein/response regulator n=1 Tax=Massariosphaeria phaeospora TaxID=100035 RepID=A0A7C8IAD1_9PLEO|nr:sensor histidine kinase-like protein/response regulator [Massariosphaeria phaeospora]